jgi:transcription elongation GreA/GreB family factor
MVQSATESRNNDTKNSAGDKYETGRAMMQQQIDMSLAEHHKAEVIFNALRSINPEQSSEKISAGSLVLTNQGIYYISVGIGKIDYDGMEFYVISPAAPLSQQMMDRRKGDQFLYAGREYTIQVVC